MTFAYSLRFLKVFFGPYKSENPKVHEAPFRFWLPAAPLAVATILFGIVPLGLQGNPFTSSTLASWFTNLAAASFAYEPKALYLWHGINLALILSAVTWVAGWLLHMLRDRFLELQQALTPSWNMNTVYYGFLERLEQVSRVVTQRTQGATFATHLRLIFLVAVLIGASVTWQFMPTTLSPIPLEFWVIAITAGAAIAGLLVAHSRLSAIIFAGLAGIASTITFVLLSAPDLALTQLLIETVTIILFLSVFRFLPRLKRYQRPRPIAVADAFLATGVAATMFTTLIAVQTPIAERIKDYFLENSKKLAGGDNVVNVILVDFRGYDTMGEITVLAIVAVSVYALLKLVPTIIKWEKK